MPKRLYGYDESGAYGSVVGDTLPDGWIRSLVNTSEQRPRRGRPAKQSPVTIVDKPKNTIKEGIEDDS